MENLNKLTRLLGADRLITAEDVQQILLGIMEILKTYKQGTESINEETKQVVNSLLEQTIKYNQETISDFKSEADKAHAERMKELQGFLSEVKTTLGDMEVMMSEVKDGKDADEERVIEEVVNRIKIDPTVVTMSAKEVRDKLASLKEEDRLDKSAIKGLEKILQQKDLDYAIATLQQQASFLINKGGLKVVAHDASLSGDGTPEDPLKVESTSGLTLETDGTPNGDQTLLNLVAGTNMTITDDGNGNITFDATGGSGSPGGSTTQLQYNNAGDFGGISGATTDGTATTYTTGNLKAADVKASGSGGLSMLSNAGTQTALFGAGGGANNTFYGDIKADYATASTVPYFDASKNLVSSAVTPTELGYVSGVTSAIQTQLNAKQATLSVSDTSEIDLTLSSNTLSASIVAGSIDEAKLDTSVNASLDLADTSVQPNSSPTLATVTTTGNIELGDASDTTLSRSAAGQLAVEGVQVATLSNAVALSNKTIAYSTEPATDDTAYGETMGGILAGDTLAQWDLVYLDSTSGRWEKADADAIGTAGNVLLGLAMTSGTDGGALTVLLKGIVRNDGWTWSGAGKVLYASTTAAAMSETAVSGEDDVVRVLGHSLSDDCIFFNPSVNWIIYKA